jgi:nucleolar complex protein 3
MKVDELPSLDSHSEDEESWSSNSDEDSEDGLNLFSSVSDGSVASSSSGLLPKGALKASRDDEEMPYEMMPRKHRNLVDSEEEGISRLPIKSQDGKIHRFEERVVPQKSVREIHDSSEEDEGVPEEVPVRRDDVATGARFGRPAVVDVISKQSRQARVQAAKEQIAMICQDIVGDPENSVSLCLLPSICKDL